jgi:hypothetical protein
MVKSGLLQHQDLPCSGVLVRSALLSFAAAAARFFAGLYILERLNKIGRQQPLFLSRFFVARFAKRPEMTQPYAAQSLTAGSGVP